MKAMLRVIGILLAARTAQCQLVPGSMTVQWEEGAKDCKAYAAPPIQVHAYNTRTFILRENLCQTFEAPFLYLLIGSTKALLIDTGDVADPHQMPIAQTVMDLLPSAGTARLPLLVVHSHRHLDHRAGDPQFAALPRVTVVGFDLKSVREFFHFSDWPNGSAAIDLGGRTVDALPTPGHNETEVSFYDRNTGLFFSGDFMMPGRLLIDDTNAELASAKRVALFATAHPISHVLGGHIEFDTAGEALPWESQYHPHEHALQLTKADLLALPAAVGSFNGFYTQTGGLILMNTMRLLVSVALLVIIVLTLLVIVAFKFRRRKVRAAAS